jgi:hypothetical protein
MSLPALATALLLHGVPCVASVWPRCRFSRSGLVACALAATGQAGAAAPEATGVRQAQGGLRDGSGVGRRCGRALHTTACWPTYMLSQPVVHLA